MKTCLHMGWHGVGMSMAAKAVAKKAQESHFFDVVVLVTAGEKCRCPRKLQRRIAEQLRLIDVGQKGRNDDDDDEEEDDDKVLGLSTEYEREIEKLDLGGVNGLLAHFHDEAGDVANTMGIDHEAEQVFSCFIYLCLFQQTTSTSMDAKELMKYYVGEGFITTHRPDGIDDLDGAFRHGEAVLGEMVTCYLNTLPPSLKHLKQLIILVLRGTPLILSNSIPSEALEQKTNLRLIDLSHTNITHSLQPSLLSSLCNLNLERLLLAGCDAFGGPPPLMSVPSPPPHHPLIGRLSELDISGRRGALKDVENVSFQDLPKLRALNLSHTPVARLSITRCASLEMVRLQGLTNLKSLHLSSVKIRESPHEISELTLLQELHLSGVKQLRRVDWEKVQWLPEKLEWDQCGCCSGSSSSSSTALVEEQLAECSSRNWSSFSTPELVGKGSIPKVVGV
ncbi:hypothetical protein ACLOJK_031147 [Asimina triloba]